jgi:hypothetical protein
MRSIETTMAELTAFCGTSESLETPVRKDQGCATNPLSTIQSD